MPIEHITDHAALAREKLLEQYQNRPRIRALIESFINRVQELEDATWDVIVKRLIDNAEGVQLDVIGDIVGELRRGREDALYRIWITARIKINKSHGHPSDVVGVIRLVEAAAFIYREFYPGSIVLEFIEALGGSAQDLHDIAEEAAPAGVRVDVVYSDAFGPEDMFSFSTVAEAGDADTARGFGLTDESTGGRFAQVVT